VDEQSSVPHQRRRGVRERESESDEEAEGGINLG
jgi:hypothetical protein